jgi:hypothetical protein
MIRVDGLQSTSALEPIQGRKEHLTY